MGMNINLGEMDWTSGVSPLLWRELFSSAEEDKMQANQT